MIYELIADYSAALGAMPREHPRYRQLSLVEEALRRDVHFTARHPTTLFQQMWNLCWWFDCQEAAEHYENGKGPQISLPEKLSCLLECWRKKREAACLNLCWLRSLRPPRQHLGTAQAAVLRGHEGAVTCVAFSPDGRRILSGSYDETVRLWNTDSGAELIALRGHHAAVWSVAFSPDGRRIVSGGAGPCGCGMQPVGPNWLS